MVVARASVAMILQNSNQGEDFFQNIFKYSSAKNKILEYLGEMRLSHMSSHFWFEWIKKLVADLAFVEHQFYPIDGSLQ